MGRKKSRKNGTRRHQNGFESQPPVPHEQWMINRKEGTLYLPNEKALVALLAQQDLHSHNTNPRVFRDATNSLSVVVRDASVHPRGADEKRKYTEYQLVVRARSERQAEALCSSLQEGYASLQRDTSGHISFFPAGRSEAAFLEKNPQYVHLGNS